MRSELIPSPHQSFVLRIQSCHRPFDLLSASSAMVGVNDSGWSGAVVLALCAVIRLVVTSGLVVVAVLVRLVKRMKVCVYVCVCARAYSRPKGERKRRRGDIDLFMVSRCGQVG